MVAQKQLAQRSKVLQEQAAEEEKRLAADARAEEAQRKVAEAKKLQLEEKLRLKAEIELLAAADHPNVARLYETYYERNQNLYLIMELCTGGSLVSRLRHHASGFNEKAAAKLIKKMLSAVTYCHKHGVVRGAARVPTACS